MILCLRILVEHRNVGGGGAVHICVIGTIGSW